MPITYYYHKLLGRSRTKYKRSLLPFDTLSAFLSFFAYAQFSAVLIDMNTISFKRSHKVGLKPTRSFYF